MAPRPVIRVVFDASCEIRNSVVFSTCIVVLVFIPLFWMSGMEGRLFTPLGIAYVNVAVVPFSDTVAAVLFSRKPASTAKLPE